MVEEEEEEEEASLASPAQEWGSAPGAACLYREARSPAH